MNTRKLAVALTSAGIATAGLGAAVLPAEAVLRTFQVTTATGQIVTVTMDLPPGTMPSPDSVGVPGAVSITEISPPPQPAPTPAPSVQVQPTPTQPAPAEPQGGGATGGGGTGTGTATAPQGAPGGGPQQSEPAGGGTGRPQGTTGEGIRGAEGVVGDAVEEADRRRRDATPGRGTRLREPGGAPAFTNPGLSLASPGPAPMGVPNFFIDKFRIPPFLLSIYQAAGIEYGVRWEVLAAINEIETDYGRNLNVSSAGALGWMQFMPATWKMYGVDANGDKRKDPYNPVDAIFAAARYLKAAGADTDLRKAIFAYNHADWYVDSVLMRARLIGGLPANLVGSLTGLTQGKFPVGARARYADDLSEREAGRRVARGRNAAVPVEANAARRGIEIYARPGAPAIAVQDGRIVRIGRTKRLGRFVQLRDAFGNTYTYARLARLAERHPVPRDVRPITPLAMPPRDPEPRVAASAGTQPRRARKAARSSRPATAARRAPVVRKERLFAAPRRPAAFRAGGRKQLRVQRTLTPPKATRSDLALLDLPADEVVMKPLRVGSRVVGGTVLGRIGRLSQQRAPHMLFELRPAGRGAPRIDPKPILDGWKLLESTAIYRAKGKNPFFGRDARTPSIGQILLMSKADLERRVLRNPRIEIYGCGRRDIRGSRVDRRVLATLEFLAGSGLRPTVTSLDCGHATYTASGNVSHHASGNAVDIARINGVPVLGHQGKGSITDIAVRRLITLQGTMKPAQIISLMDYDGADNTLAMGDHADHIHVGFTPYFDTDSTAGRQLGAALRPGQWIKLVDRLGRIDNPTVRLEPSDDALVVKPRRASRRHRGE